jgi:hypothetical protein
MLKFEIIIILEKQMFLTMFMLQKFDTSKTRAALLVHEEETMTIVSPVMTWTMMTPRAMMSRRTMPARGRPSRLNPLQP